MSPWWQQALVYEIYPRSFQDSDGNGLGDLTGTKSRLDYLEWLGVDAIWLAPIYRSPLADFGYDVVDHTSIAPEIGTDRELDQLVEEAHRRDIRIILDLVVSHTSIEHPWFREHPDFYVWADGGPANNWIASFGGSAWSLDEQSGRWYLHSFFPEQPDLDWRNPGVREEMAAVVRHWLERGVDGFRVDAADRLMKDAGLRDDPVGAQPFPLPLPSEAHRLQPVHSRDDPDIGVALRTLREAAGSVPLFGEVYLPLPRLGRYLDHFDSVFAFELLHAEWDAAAIAEVLERLGDGSGLAWVTSNHDFSRAATRWGERAVAAAAMLLLTLPGCAFIYQGEEIGMHDGSEGTPPMDRYGRDRFRSPMQWESAHFGGFSTGTPWLPVTDPSARNVADQRRDPDSLLNLYRRLIRVRRKLSGPIKDIHCDGDLLSFGRGHRHRVLLNTGPAPLRLPPEEGRVIELATAGPRAEEQHLLGPGQGLLIRSAGESSSHV